MNRSLFRQFFGPQLIVLFGGLAALGSYAWHVQRSGYTREWRHVMSAQLGIVSRLAIRPDGALQPPDVLQRMCDEIRRDEGVRITVVRSDGTVLADSNAASERMHSHADRPEVAEALRTGHGWSVRYSVTLQDELLYAARRIGPAEAPLAVIRVANPRGRSYAPRLQALRILLGLLLATALLTLALSYAFALRIIRPVAGMQAKLGRIGAGDLSQRVAVPPGGHLRDLALALNETVARLQHHVHTLEDERALRARILTGMAEGLLAMDTRRVLVDANAAALRLLDLDDGRPVVGQLLHERVHGPELPALVDQAERRDDVAECELQVGAGATVRTLWARATALPDGQGGRQGTLVMLGDMTQVRRLERVRRDFVANVSHELRTPVTAIMGFAETLLDNPDLSAEQVRRFLGIVRRQANQMAAILDDLLVLSRLDEQGTNIPRAAVVLPELLQRAADICRPRAEAVGMAIRIDCADGLNVAAHANLLEQAVINLVDNAVKYAAAGGRVEISARIEDQQVAIRVRDYGPGIAPEHHARIFERFYRVDEGRARDAGGTGLGLSIVRHVARVHGGTVSVQNAPGGGCIFVLTLGV